MTDISPMITIGKHSSNFHSQRMQAPCSQIQAPCDACAPDTSTTASHQTKKPPASPYLFPPKEEISFVVNIPVLYIGLHSYGKRINNGFGLIIAPFPPQETNLLPNTKQMILKRFP
jgi:hypothetical protein